jgi:hypothetical protein
LFLVWFVERGHRIRRQTISTRHAKQVESPIFQGEVATMAIQAKMPATHFVATSPAALQKM